MKMETSDKTRITTPGRSEGDGMENISQPEFDSIPNWSSVHSQKQPVNFYPKHFAPSQGKLKEPKFVPYEPYKAAVSPLIPEYKHQVDKAVPKVVIDSQRVNSLASSIIKLYSDLESRDAPSEVHEKGHCAEECALKVQLLEERISALEKEKKELTSQYQVQTEVNADLKKMLVASLGEDVQLKVQFMTEDKALLGKEVLRLSDELEKTRDLAEKMAVQCEIWESKFKASSLMVKELAQWKSSLSRNLNQSVDGLNAMMKEHESLFEILCVAHRSLKCTLAAYDPMMKAVPNKSLTPSSIPQLTLELKSLSNKIQERLLGKSLCDSRSNTEGKSMSSQYIRQFSPTENLINQILKSFENSCVQTSDAMSNGVHTTPGAIACQVLPHVCSKGIMANFCRHCSGEIKVI